jgi:hypothetical protein
MFEWQVGFAIAAGILVVAALAARAASRSEPTDAAGAWDAGFADPAKTGLFGNEGGIYIRHRERQGCDMNRRRTVTPGRFRLD